MTTLWISIAAFAAASAVTARATPQIAATRPLERANYRGLTVTAAGGIAPLAGLTVAMGVLAGLSALAPGSARIGSASAWGARALAVALAFGLLGLWDDLAAGPERGWRAHLRAIARGRATSGAFKLACGGAIALGVAATRGRGLWWSLADAAILALCANALNLLDVRPGRAAKGTLLAVAPMLALGGATAPFLAAVAGATIAFLPFDLRERAMLGDTGANALGAAVGMGVLALGSDTARLVTLGLLVLMHAIADGPSISRVIGAVPPLRALDRAGRAPE